MRASGHVPVYGIHEWEDPPTEKLLAYVSKTHKGFGAHAVPGPTDAPNVKPCMPEEFCEHAVRVFAEMGYEAVNWRYWVSEIRFESDKEDDVLWAKGFPHTHGWDGLTLVHYLQVPESGGALVIRDENKEVIESFQPEVGMTSVIDGRTEHGVERVFGDVPRVTVIATGFIE